MLGAFALMRAFGITGNLMSLGAIDFGLVVDGSVVVVEGALAAMAARRMNAREALIDEARLVGKPIAFGVFIVGLVYVPILLLEGVEGKMFRPMAFTVLFALGTALVLTFTWVPALASLLLRRVHEREPWLVRQLRRGYEPILLRGLAHPRAALRVEDRARPRSAGGPLRRGLAARAARHGLQLHAAHRDADPGALGRHEERRGDQDPWR